MADKPFGIVGWWRGQAQVWGWQDGQYRPCSAAFPIRFRWRGMSVLIDRDVRMPITVDGINAEARFYVIHPNGGRTEFYRDGSIGRAVAGQAWKFCR